MSTLEMGQTAELAENMKRVIKMFIAKQGSTILAAAVLLAGCGAGGGTETADKPTTTLAATTTTTKPVDLYKIVDSVYTPPPGVLIDGDAESATVDILYPSKPEIDWLKVVLKRLEMPSATASLMEETRAVDGMQSIDGPLASARWTYHPDDGLSVVFIANT